MLAKLSIVEQPPVGRGAGGVPITPPARPPIERIVRAGHVLKFSRFDRPYTIAIVQITDNTLTLRSAEAVVYPAGTVDVARGPEGAHEAVIKIGESAIFATPIFDSGMTWKITLQAILPDEASQGASNTSSLPNPPRTPPKIQYPNLKWERTQDLIQKIEEKLGKRLLCYYTHPSTPMSPVHADLFLDHLRFLNDQENLALCIITNGGAVTAPLRIGTLIRDYCQSLTILVPSRCASAGTILALAADMIIMTPNGFLTAIDCSITHPLNPQGPDKRPTSISVDQIKRVMHLLQSEDEKRVDKTSESPYRTLFHYLHPVALGEIDRSTKTSEMIAERLMNLHPASFSGPQRISEIAQHLISNYPAHDFPILYNEAKTIGLPVEKSDKELSGLLWDLVKVFGAIATPLVTHLSPIFYHHESFPVIIESRDKRTTFRQSYNRRFNPMTRSWQTETDKSDWVSILPGDNPAQPFKIAPLDMPMDASPIEAKEEKILEPDKLPPQNPPFTKPVTENPPPTP
jgi:hypothetical protein